MKYPESSNSQRQKADERMPEAGRGQKRELLFTGYRVSVASVKIKF